LWEAYVRALRGRGDWTEAARLVRERMIASGQWAAWPAMTARSRLGAGEVNTLNFDLATHFDDASIAAPMLLVETDNEDGDIETLVFQDGPYVVGIDREDPEYTERMVGGAQRGERAYIPLWRVDVVYPPPFGIPQEGYEYLREGSLRQAPIDVSYGPVVHVDGPVISEDNTGFWTAESDEHLAIPAAIAAMEGM
jgi:hypothetical protein